ncbi:MAG: hypothetical protein OIN84_09570, partial [Candidatus Methanoperedens sp.]|nr:hypothetical protein [Candidatus Methanoperedens sp.]
RYPKSKKDKHMIANGVDARVVTEDDLVGLPAPVYRYLTFTGVIGTPRINTVRLKYGGKFRMAADKPWMPISVTQYYTTNPQGFLWKARFKMAGLPLMIANDVYKSGHGHMRGKLLGLFTVADGRGEEIDQGTMVRYLQEMTWFPSAYLGSNIRWQAVDDHAADVTLTDGDREVTARMYFDDRGRLLTFIAQRYGDFKGEYKIRTWTTPVTEYGFMAGLYLPVAGLGVWQLPEGDLTYINVHLSEIEYNQPIEMF